MGRENQILHQLLARLLARGRHDPQWRQRVITLILGAGLLLLLGCGFLLYLGLGLSKNLLANKPELDLLALDKLVAAQALVLTPEQQQRLAPLARELATPGLAAEKAAALKAQLLEIIPPAQMARLESLQAAASSGGLLNLPPVVASLIEGFTGYTPAEIAALLESWRAWWQGNKPPPRPEQGQTNASKP